MRALAAAFGMQLRSFRTDPQRLLVLVTMPMVTVALLSIVRDAARPGLDGYAVLAPAVMGLFQMALNEAGEVIDQERWAGTLELTFAAPTAFLVLVAGRIAAVILVGLVAFAESWLVGVLGFGAVVRVAHPGVFVLAMAATVLATIGAAAVMAGTFVLARSTRTYQNSISYPIYILGGVMVPVAALPGWLHPAARAVYLSWSTDLLREALDSGPVTGLGPHLAVIVGLGVAFLAAGGIVVSRFVHRVRVRGTVTHA
jgi:ABC-2 type transport system permease protein